MRISFAGQRQYLHCMECQVMKAAKIKFGQEATVNLKLDLSPYSMEMPEELVALLEQDEAGKSRFDQLTPGKQRTIMHSVMALNVRNCT